MAWNIAERFPSWGETGEFPASGFFYEGGDQVNEKHLDALWNGINGLEEDVQGALNDIDSNADGVVDKAESGAAGFDLDGDLLAAGGEVVWDESANYIPQARLQNDIITLNAGDGLNGGGSVALGSSVSTSVDVSDIIGTGVTGDGSNNIELDETVIKDGGAKQIDAAEFSGDTGSSGQVLQTDGADATWAEVPSVTVASETNDGSDLTEYVVPQDTSGSATLLNVSGSGIFLGGLVFQDDASSSNTTGVGAEVTVDGGATYDVTSIRHTDGNSDDGTIGIIPSIKFESSLIINVYDWDNNNYISGHGWIKW